MYWSLILSQILLRFLWKYSGNPSHLHPPRVFYQRRVGSWENREHQADAAVSGCSERSALLDWAAGSRSKSHFRGYAVLSSTFLSFDLPYINCSLSSQPLVTPKPFEMTTPVDLGSTSTSTSPRVGLLKVPALSSTCWRSPECVVRWEYQSAEHFRNSIVLKPNFPVRTHASMCRHQTKETTTSFTTCWWACRQKRRRFFPLETPLSTSIWPWYYDV